MAADRNTGHTEEDKLDVLKSTQTVIHKALEKLGYRRSVRTVKGADEVINGKNTCSYGRRFSKDFYRLSCAAQ